ncbi:DeoR family transcriptional regulator [Candidatus Nomurabacteria bacterium]|nr:DeoR family transcriptional regulator [Candidatus Nomurabacteria bacterium]
MENNKRNTKDIKVFYKGLDYGVLFSNRNSLFLFKKTERVAAALYLISESFPVREPLRWSIRTGAGDIIKDLLTTVDQPSVESSNKLKDIKKKMFELSSYVSVANISGLVSNMNSSILLQEMDNLTTALDFEIKRHPSVDDSIAIDFFETDIKDIKKTHKGQKEDETKTVTGVYKNFSNSESGSRGVDSTMSFIKQTKQGSSSEKEIANKSFSNRKADILDILKSDGKVSIKDISDKIAGCSEKTIQRDLIQLINEGLVIKEGERRWSKYFLKN